MSKHYEGDMDKNSDNKILIVEDDETLLAMYKDRFQKEGIKVLEAKNGEEAIPIALGEMPSVILLDLMLPEKGGLGVLEVLKTQPITQNIPIIILTAYPKDEYRQKALRTGAKMFFSKSETMPGEVVEEVKKLLQSKNQ